MSEKPKNNRLTRVITASILVPLLCLLLYLRSWVLGVALIACIAITIFEEFRALKLGGHNPVAFTTWVACIAFLPLQMLFPQKAVIVPLISIMMIAIILVVCLRKEPNLVDIMVSTLPMLSLALPGMCLISLLNIQNEALQITFIVSVFTIAIISDTFAYEFGTRFGKTKLCPAVSPNKTVEGAIGGLIGGVVGILLTGEIVRLFAGGLKIPATWELILIGIFGSIVAQTGDLFASLLKRHCNIKDFGTLFPGHGGMLDRLDSVLFVAVYMYCIKLVFF